MGTLVLGMSVALQLVAAALALRLIRQTGRRLPWALIAAAILLMTVRRTLTLVELLTGDPRHTVSLRVESVALVISILMVIGVSRIAEVFRSVAEAERARRVTELRLADVVRSSPDGLVVLGRDARVRAANPAALQMLRVAGDDAVGLDLEALPALPSELRDAIAVMLAGTSETPPVTREVELVDGVGAPVVWEASIRPIHVDEVEGDVELVLRDVSARRRTAALRATLERQAGEVRRLDAIGRLAGGVAHDFNNLLTVILGGLSFLRRRARDPADVEEIEHVTTAAQRAAELTQQLLAVGRKNPADGGATDLVEQVRTLRPLLERLIGEDVALTFELPERPAWVPVPSPPLEQVIVNLAVNARDAMPGGGDLAFRAELVDLDEDRAAQSGIAPGPYVALHVRDSGHGMDEATRERVFEPFFTTKGVGGGTGLGMATVYGILRQAGGQVLVESAPGRGTEFTLYFPEAPPETTGKGAEVGPPRGAAPSVGATLLVVEDEEPVRRIIVRVLKGAGYQVRAAANAAEAEAAWDACGGAVDLLVTDVTMPGRSGVDLARDLVERRADLAVLLISGYADTRGKDGQHRPATRFLAKPFEAEELLEAVGALLPAPRAGQAVVGAGGAAEASSKRQ